SLVFVLLVGGYDVRILPAARSAPRCPEVKQHIALAQVVRKTDGSTIRCGRCEIRSLIAGQNSLQCTGQAVQYGYVLRVLEGRIQQCRMVPDFLRAHPVGKIAVQYVGCGNRGRVFLDERVDLNIPCVRAVRRKAVVGFGSGNNRVAVVVGIECHRDGRIVKKDIQRCLAGIERKAIEFGQLYVRIESETAIAQGGRVDGPEYLVVKSLEVNRSRFVTFYGARKLQGGTLLCLGGSQEQQEQCS